MSTRHASENTLVTSPAEDYFPSLGSRAAPGDGTCAHTRADIPAVVSSSPAWGPSLEQACSLNVLFRGFES